MYEGTTVYINWGSNVNITYTEWGRVQPLHAIQYDAVIMWSIVSKILHVVACEFKVWSIFDLCYYNAAYSIVFPDRKSHEANMGPIWGRQDPGGPHICPMNFAFWVIFDCIITAPDCISILRNSRWVLNCMNVMWNSGCPQAQTVLDSTRRQYLTSGRPLLSTPVIFRPSGAPIANMD